MPESEAVFEEAAFVDLALLAAARVGAALSLLELELCEPERVFSPLADEEVSDLLFDLKERLSAGIFFGVRVVWSSGEQNGDRGTKANEGVFEGNCPRRLEKNKPWRSQRATDTIKLPDNRRGDEG